MKINAALDEGDMLMQKEVEIRAGEHAPALFERLAAIGAPVLNETLEHLAAGALTPQPQRHDDATPAPVLTREDGEVDPGQLEARLVEGRVRGFDPWPGVWLRRGAKRLRLVRAETIRDTSGLPVSAPWHEPGTLVDEGSGGVAMICAGHSALRLIEVQPDGRGVIGASDALNGRQIVLGERLEPVRPD